jgi:subtilisin-like proprotein convertase family protein
LVLALPAGAEAQLVTPDFEGGPITIADGGSSPYPATISVATDRTIVEDVDVRLRQLSHDSEDSLDLLLAGPGGQGMVLVSDAGGSGTAVPDTITFDDQAAGPVPDAMVTGTYQPTNEDDGSADAFPSPAPAGPFGAMLSTFRLLDPNGTWSLYVVDDDADGIGGSIISWRLTLTARRPAVMVISYGEAREGGPPLRVVFTRLASGAALHPATWSFDTPSCAPSPCGPSVRGRAAEGVDYSGMTTTLNFAAGEIQKVVDIPIVDDKIPERRELFFIRNTAATGDAQAGRFQNQAIIDNDPSVDVPRVARSGPQRILAQRHVRVRATSNTDGRLSARGTISVPGASAVIRLRRAARAVTAGRRATLRLRVPRAGLHRIRAALTSGKRLKARVVVTARDLAGNTQSKTVAIRLRR